MGISFVKKAQKKQRRLRQETRRPVRPQREAPKVEGAKLKATDKASGCAAVTSQPDTSGTTCTNEHSELLDVLKGWLNADPDGQLREALEEKCAFLIQESAVLSHLRTRFDYTKRRFADEVVALARRANLHLIIGCIATLLAVGLLACMIPGQYAVTDELLRSEPEKQVAEPVTSSVDWTTLWSQYPPRLSLVVLLEVFSYFFLRLYKEGLHEIRYFHNESTNVEAVFIALEGAFLTSDLPTITEILSQLAATDRNFILRPGESTPDLERMKVENQILKDLLQAVSGLLKKQDGGG
jgi:hypothetical protein